MKSRSRKFKHLLNYYQIDLLIVIVSILAAIVGGITIGLPAIIAVILIDMLIFGWPKIWTIIRKVNKPTKKYTRTTSKADKPSPTKTVNKKTNSTRHSRKKGKHPVFKTLVKIGFILGFTGAIVAFVTMILFFSYIVTNAPEFNPDKMFAHESSILYDKDGNEYAKLGLERREKIDYEALPEVLVNAILATEDSRYFQHNGFDLPRFAKATFNQILNRPGAGGASTLTMQVAKNSFTSRTDEGIEGLIRKFTDIYLSIFKIEKNYTKQEIIEFYVNTYLLGGNIFGVEQACISYFGKSAKDINLSEAAIIAGLFQSPNTYNPLINPENAAARRKIVLTLMVRHGYITQEEADIANAISVEDLIKNGKGSTSKNPYQGFIDTVVAEVKKDTGNNPYAVSMKIYTTMDRKKQNGINNIMSGKTFKWENKVVDAGISVLNTKTGEIVAIGTGRDTSKAGLWNNAIQINRQIGSTAKPLYDYGPAYEYNNLSPGAYVIDEKYTYSNGVKIDNWDGGYHGLIGIKDALGGSRNIPALKTFQSVKKAQILEFVTNLGLSPEAGLHEAHSIGGYNGESPLTLSAAYAAFGNKGYYNKPYSYTSIIYRDTNEKYEKKKYSKKAMSEATAYLMHDSLLYAAPMALYDAANINGYKFMAKTGTTNFTPEIKRANKLPDDAINDLWAAGGTDECTWAVWYGYQKIDRKYFTHFGNMSHTKLFQAVGKAVLTRSSNVTRPSDVINVNIEAQSMEPLLPSEYTPSNMIRSVLYKKGTEPTEVSKRFAQLENPTSVNGSYSSGIITLSWDYAKNDILTDAGIKAYFKPYATSSLNSMVSSRKSWNNSNLGAVGYDIYENNNGTLTKVGSTTKNYIDISINSFRTYNYIIKTAHSKYKTNQSTGVSKSVTASASGGSIISFQLNGSSTLRIPAGTSYIDPGIAVIDNGTPRPPTSVIATISPGNITYNNGTIPALTLGTYTIAYQVNYNGIVYPGSKTETRTLIVE